MQVRIMMRQNAGLAAVDAAMIMPLSAVCLVAVRLAEYPPLATTFQRLTVGMNLLRHRTDCDFGNGFQTITEQGL